MLPIPRPMNVHSKGSMSISLVIAEIKKTVANESNSNKPVMRFM
jgi:hypothetical protein